MEGRGKLFLSDVYPGWRSQTRLPGAAMGIVKVAERFSSFLFFFFKSGLLFFRFLGVSSSKQQSFSCTALACYPHTMLSVPYDDSTSSEEERARPIYFWGSAS